MQRDQSLAHVRQIMTDFAGRTGLSRAGQIPCRYLWTDAFAVCNFLELYRRTSGDSFRSLALNLVTQVHETLGRHRQDDSRTGWLSSLDEAEGRLHPTAGGLRIGKALQERQPDEPYDDQLEWDRDGQYYHYLTKWMLALNRVASKTGSTLYNRWALELAETAHAAFTYLPLGESRPRMYWKMSIDLSRPLVSTMGHHDPLDGLLTFHELQAQAAAGSKQAECKDLTQEIRDLVLMCEGVNWLSDDPLGLGGLLSDALRTTRLMVNNKIQLDDLLMDLLDAGAKGLSYFKAGGSLQMPPVYRLAFRELGLAIGLHAAERIEEIFREKANLFASQDNLAARLQEILSYLPLCRQIEDFWINPENQRIASWTEHRDINMVMLATSLAPDGYFGIEK